MKYLKKLEEYDDNEKLVRLLGWLNDGYARKLWNQATRKTKSRVNRTQMREVYTLVCELMESRGMPVDQEPKRNNDYTLLFGVSMANVDMPKLCAELRQHYERDLERGKEVQNEKLAEALYALEGYLLLFLSTRVKGPRPLRKLSNQLLSRTLFLHKQWSKERDEHPQDWPPMWMAEDRQLPEPCKEMRVLVENAAAFRDWLMWDECVLAGKENAVKRIDGLLP